MGNHISERLVEDDIVWDYDKEVAGPVAGPGHLPVRDPRCVWICCQEQLQWAVPEAWPFPLGSRT